MSRIFKILLFLAWCALYASAASADVRIKVAYSEAANVFDIMDNVSNWWPGFCEEEYQKYWDNKFPLSDADRQLFAKYKALRNSYYDDPDQAEKDPLKNRNGFFATLGAISADPLAKAFYSSSTLDEAFDKLQKLIKPSELDFLRSFYSTFAGRYKLLLGESASFKAVVQQVSKTLSAKEAKSYFEKVSRFFRVKADIEYTVLYVWWPPIDRTNASPTGNYLVMRYNPIKDIKIAALDSDVAFHEIVHTIAARQDLQQKQDLTKEFLSSCKIRDRIKKLNVLDEPLAVVFGQAIFLQKFMPNRFDYGSNWYAEQWTNAFAKLIFPTLKAEIQADRTITDGVIPKLAAHCQELIAAADKIGPSSKP